MCVPRALACLPAGLSAVEMSTNIAIGAAFNARIEVSNLVGALNPSGTGPVTLVDRAGTGHLRLFSSRRGETLDVWTAWKGSGQTHAIHMSAARLGRGGGSRDHSDSSGTGGIARCRHTCCGDLECSRMLAS